MAQSAVERTGPTSPARAPSGPLRRARRLLAHGTAETLALVDRDACRAVTGPSEDRCASEDAVTKPTTFDAVLFDLDGVLVDTEPWWDEVRVDFAREHDRPWGREDQHAVMGGSFTMGRGHARAAGSRTSRAGRDPGCDRRRGRREKYRAAAALPLIPGAVETVRRVAATHLVAIASSAHRAVIQAAVDALGLGAILDEIVSSDDVAAGKPDPAVYLLAAARLGVDPGRCLVVEDSVNGVRPARPPA